MTTIFPIPAQPFAYPTAYEHGFRCGRQVAHHLVDVTASGRDPLAAALAIPFTDIVYGHHVATHAIVDPTHGLVLFRDRAPEAAFALAEPLTHAAAVDAVWAWLAKCPYGGHNDDHDGASRAGFRVYNHTFGIVGEWWGAFVAILPMLIYLPK